MKIIVDITFNKYAELEQDIDLTKMTADQWQNIADAVQDDSKNKLGYIGFVVTDEDGNTLYER